MILDKENLFSDAQAIIATAASDNIIDLGATGKTWSGAQLVRDIGPGVPLPLLVRVVAAFNNCTSLKIALQVDDNSSFSSATTVAEQTLLLAALTAGADFPFRYVPKGVNERYLRLYFTVAGTAPTAGKITAGIVAGWQANP